MGLFLRISRQVERREKSRFQPALFYSRAIYRPVGLISIGSRLSPLTFYSPSLLIHFGHAA